MRIIGWIRQNDRAACGGTVVEGFQHCTSWGVPYTYLGAQMACKKNCKIIEGSARRTWNGQQFVIHGMKTSGGCPLISTLNDTDGVGNDGGERIPLSFIQDQNGEWIGNTFAEQTGKRFLVRNSETGEPIANRKFIAIVGGVKQEGTTDNDGYAHVDAKAGASIELHTIFEAPNGPLTYGGV
jgi:uncharacterized Zn-binding protein involved in type VI secretion